MIGPRSVKVWRSRPLIYLLLAAGLGLSVLPLGGTPQPVVRVRHFPALGLEVASPFVELWEQPAGSYAMSVAISGLPLGPRQPMTLPDGSTRPVQWFERARYELHAEEAPPYDVQLGALGREATAGRRGEPPFQPVPPPADPAVWWFAETGHTLAAPFLGFWLQYGGVRQFGFTISEPFTEREADGQTYTVQYFERARLELHPGASPATNDVVVGRLGAELYKP